MDSVARPDAGTIDTKLVCVCLVVPNGKAASRRNSPRSNACNNALATARRSEASQQPQKQKQATEPARQAYSTQHSMTDLPPAEGLVLQRQATITREEFLINYTTEKCTSRSDIDFEEGWGILQEYGIDVVADILARDLVEKKPFGNRGSVPCSQLHDNTHRERRTREHT